MEQTDRVISKERSSQGAEAGFAPAKPTGAFERYRQAVPKERVAQMLAGLAAFSREGPFSAWIYMRAQGISHQIGPVKSDSRQRIISAANNIDGQPAVMLVKPVIGDN